MNSNTKTKLIKQIETLSDLCYVNGVSEKKYTNVMTGLGLPPSEEDMDDRLNSKTKKELQMIVNGLTSLTEKCS